MAGWFRAGAWALAIAAAAPGCAFPAAVAPLPGGSSGAPSAQPGAAAAEAVRTPDFVAVAVRPGETLASLAGIWLGDPARSWEIGAYNGVREAAAGDELVIPLRPFRRGGLDPDRYQTVPVLVYHQFAEQGANRTTVARAAFEEQMRLLRDRGFHVIRLEQLLAFLEFRGQLPERAVAITIDDGWRSAYDIAFPILKSHGYPATLFVQTGLIDSGENALSWDQVREMAAQGLDVQGHAISHRSLSRPLAQESPGEYAAAVAREIAESTRAIEQNVGRRPVFFAHPYGEINGLVITLLKQEGYRAAFTEEREANPFFAAPFRLGRSVVLGEDGLEAFEKNLTTSDERALR